MPVSIEHKTPVRLELREPIHGFEEFRLLFVILRGLFPLEKSSKEECSYQEIALRS